MQLSPWQNMTGSDAGRIRQLTFVTPLAGALKGVRPISAHTPAEHGCQRFPGLSAAS